MGGNPEGLVTMFTVKVGYAEYSRNSFRSAVDLAMQLQIDGFLHVEICDDFGLVVRFESI